MGKVLGESDTNNNNIQQEYRNGILHRKFAKKINNRRNGIVKPRKNQNASRKENLVIVEADTIKQVDMKKIIKDEC